LAGTGGGDDVVYRAWSNTDSVVNPHNTSPDQVVSGLTVSFTLAASSTVLVRAQVNFKKNGGGTSLPVYDNGSALMATAPTVAAGLNTTNYVTGEVSWLGTLASGSHTVDIREEAVDNTNAITFGNRFLEVRVLA
jgi:hypothetical protein